jgi:DNA-directed RNA polymerase subunit RPC12/RpoP
MSPDQRDNIRCVGCGRRAILKLTRTSCRGADPSRPIGDPHTEYLCESCWYIGKAEKLVSSPQGSEAAG